MAPVLADTDHDRRTQALACWCARFDPDHQRDSTALREAAAVAPLVPTAAGVGLEEHGFRDLVAFITAMPF